MSSELVKYHNWCTQYMVVLHCHWNPELQARIKEYEARIADGVPPVTDDAGWLEDAITRIYDKHPEWPRRYKLPTQFQWTQPWNPYG